MQCTRNKVDLRIPNKREGFLSTSPKNSKTSPNQFKAHKSHSPTPKPSKKKPKVNKELLDYCFSRLKVSMELIRSVETKLKSAVTLKTPN